MASDEAARNQSQQQAPLNVLFDSDDAATENVVENVAGNENNAENGQKPFDSTQTDSSTKAKGKAKKRKQVTTRSIVWRHFTRIKDKEGKVKEVNKEEENEKIKPIEKKKRKRDKGNNSNTGKSIQLIKEVKEEDEENQKIKPNVKTNKRRDKGNDVDTEKVVQLIEEKNIKADGKKRKNKAVKKKRKHDQKNNSRASKSNQLGEGGLDKQHGETEDKSPNENQRNIGDIKLKSETIDETETRARKSKKSKKRKKECGTSQESEKRLKEKEVIQDETYCISSGEEDCSKGMKKWLMEYHQSRPGSKVLQQRIDDFIIAHEEKLEHEMKEREAEASKDGWTVVVHHKGRKKTTDSESGVTVGSVAPAVAENLGTAKKHKEVNMDFYRFQKRESQRNEILALQNKFEQDKKRIQQLRAARKFRRY